MNCSRVLLPNRLLALLFGLWIGMGASSALAQSSIQFNPPPSGAPGNRESAAQRNPCALNKSDRLVLLLPEDGFGLTTSAQPTFFVYLPAIVEGQIEFNLYDETGNTLYRDTLTAPIASGIQGFSMPQGEHTPSLAVGSFYRWNVSVLCPNGDEQNLSVGDGAFTSGVVQRIAPSSELRDHLQDQSSDRIPSIYATSGIWYDSLTQLAALMQASPADESLQEQWGTLLNAVGLSHLTDYPILFYSTDEHYGD